jgi:peptide chain release factor 1
MIDSLVRMAQRYEELTAQLADPDVLADPSRLQELAQERSDLEDTVERFRRYQSLEQQIAEAQALLDAEDDPAMAELAREEIATLEPQAAALLSELRELLVPRDPNDQKNVIVEIRAGAGGDEAALFAADLFRAYSRFAERHHWTTEVIDAHETGIGGFKEIVFEIRGRGAYSFLKYESGVHRVQRVPETEANGRIHTSTATVAVLPEVDEVQVAINPDDLRIDVFRSSGAGGQQTQEIEAARRSQVGTGDRSEKIRTYNFPQDRITDHRIGFTAHHLEGVLDGDLDGLIAALVAEDRRRAEGDEGRGA